MVRIFKHDFSFKNTGATACVSHHKQDHLNQYQNTDCIVLVFFSFYCFELHLSLWWYQSPVVGTMSVVSHYLPGPWHAGERVSRAQIFSVYYLITLASWLLSFLFALIKSALTKESWFQNLSKVPNLASQWLH